jgi:hypothetical protein
MIHAMLPSSVNTAPSFLECNLETEIKRCVSLERRGVSWLLKRTGGLGRRKNNEREISRIVNSQRASKCHASLNSNISSEKLASTENSALGYRIIVSVCWHFVLFFRLDPKLMYVSLSR